jgi:hypothetical protein
MSQSLILAVYKYPADIDTDAGRGHLLSVRKDASSEMSPADQTTYSNSVTGKLCVRG